MNKDIFQGKWHELKGQVRNKWGRLTDDEIESLEGNNEQIYGFLQKHYGLARQEAEKQIKELLRPSGNA
jgi:uncharacterized protein YjbJ (UPF0337 family)